MTRPATKAKFRLGSKVPLNVYEGDRPVCQCHTAKDAALIVESVNRTLPMTHPQNDPLAALEGALDTLEQLEMDTGAIYKTLPMREELQRVRALIQAAKLALPTVGNGNMRIKLFDALAAFRVKP